jgi:hypothetical protein
LLRFRGNADCAQALAPATIVVSGPPRSSSAAKSQVYEIERFEAVVPSGRLTLKPDARADTTSRPTNSATSGTSGVPLTTNTLAAAVMTAAT